jgi:hypothetical protein
MQRKVHSGIINLFDERIVYSPDNDLSAVKEGQQKYCETFYSRSGINHMWILKHSKDLLDNLKSRSFSHVSSIKTLDFSTLCTTLPHDKLKNPLKETIHKAFSHRYDGSKCVVLGYNSTYFSNKIQKGKTCHSEEQVISMLKFLIDNIFVSFGGVTVSAGRRHTIGYELCPSSSRFICILIRVGVSSKSFKR